MIWIIRLILLMAAPIAAAIVARDSLQFTIVQTFMATFLIALMVAALGFLPGIVCLFQRTLTRRQAGR